ncbi:tetratricopeptide repeat protein [Leifsonia sp. CL154]|uniref:tetratricopeptide repeat protein n=1 Tax=Leifsonia sp. CL154 TaxID=1798214 RepID=UPI0034A1684F
MVGAITQFEHLLADRLRVLGPDHPDTLSTRSNLAYWRARVGEVAVGLLVLCERVDMVEHVLGRQSADRGSVGVGVIDDGDEVSALPDAVVGRIAVR